MWYVFRANGKHLPLPSIRITPLLIPSTLLPLSSWFGIGKTQILIKSNLMPPCACLRRTDHKDRKKTNVCRLLSFCILAYNPEWVLNAARQSDCNSWMYSFSLDKYPFHCAFTQKIESNFPQGPTPTFIHLHPPVPIHSAFPPITWIELCILAPLSSSRILLQKAYPSPYYTITFPSRYWIISINI